MTVFVNFDIGRPRKGFISKLCRGNAINLFEHTDKAAGMGITKTFCNSGNGKMRIPQSGACHIKLSGVQIIAECVACPVSELMTQVGRLYFESISNHVDIERCIRVMFIDKSKDTADKR